MGQENELDCTNRRCSRHLWLINTKIDNSLEWRGLPVSSAMKSESPIPIGAMKVPLCFSVANIKIVKVSWAVRNISINRPWMIEVPAPNFVCTAEGPGKSTETIAAAAIPPNIWETASKAPRRYGSAPTRHIPKVTWKSAFERPLGY